MAAWMRHGPKDVVETDDDDNVSEQELYHHIKSQLEFCKRVFQHLTSSYRKLVRLEQRRREARSRELKQTRRHRKTHATISTIIKKYQGCRQEGPGNYFYE